MKVRISMKTYFLFAWLALLALPAMALDSESATVSAAVKSTASTSALGLALAPSCPDEAEVPSLGEYAMIQNSPRQDLNDQMVQLLHGDFTVRMARETARRIELEGLPGVDEQVVRAWSLILQRPPDAVEAQMSQKLFERHGLWAVCLGLFNANEFVVVP